MVKVLPAIIIENLREHLIPLIPTGQCEVDTGSKKAEWNKEKSSGLSQRSSGWGKDNGTHVFHRLCIQQYVLKAWQLINTLY